MFTIGSVVAIFKSDLSDFNKGVDTAKKTVSGFSEKAATASKAFTAGVTAMTVAAGVFGFKAVQAYNEATEAQVKLTKIILNHSGETMKNVDALNAQAKAMQKVGVVGADLVTVAQAQFATFDLSSDSIQKLIPRFLDMVVAEKGVNATTEDLKGAAQGLGQAFMGNYASLSKQGFAISDAQKKMIEFGDESEKVQAIQEILGTTYDGVNEAQRRTFQGGLIAAKNNLGDLMQSIGEFITGFLKPLVLQFNKWFDAMGGTDGIMKKLQENWEWLIAHKEIIIGGLLGGMALALKGVAVAAIDSLIALAPYLVVGAAIGLLAQKVAKDMGGWAVVWGKLKAGIDGVRAALTMIVTGDYNGKLGKAVGAGAEDDEIITKIFAIRDALMQLFNFFKPSVDRLVSAFRDHLLPVLREFWDKHGEEIKKLLKYLAEFIGVVVVGAIWLLINIFTGLVYAVEGVIKAFEWYYDTARRVFAEVKQKAQEFWQALKDGVEQVKIFFTQDLPNALNQLKDAFVAAIGAMIEWFKKLPENIIFGIGWIAGRFVRFITEDVPNFINQTIAWFNTLPGKVYDAAVRTWATFTDWMRRLWNDAKQTTVDGANSVANFFSTLPGRIGNFARQLWDNAKAGFTSFKDNSIKWAQDTINSIVQFFSDLPGKIVSALKNGVGSIGSGLKNIGNDLLRGFKSGLGIPGAANGIQNFAGGNILVGERGPEIVKLPSGSSVIPNHEIGGMSAGGYTINNYNNFNSEAAVEAFDELMKRRNLAARLGVPSV